MNGYSTKREGKGEVVNERGERVRMRWKGQITDKTIKLLTRYYGKAIRSSTGLCAAMQDAAWEFFLPLPVLSTSIAPVASGLGASSTGHLPIPSHPQPLTHHPSRHCSASQKGL